jgi:hypothetical protein
VLGKDRKLIAGVELGWPESGMYERVEDRLGEYDHGFNFMSTSMVNIYAM